jgi:hypothetical protein
MRPFGCGGHRESLSTPPAVSVLSRCWAMTFNLGVRRRTLPLDLAFIVPMPWTHCPRNRDTRLNGIGSGTILASPEFTACFAGGSHGCLANGLVQLSERGLFVLPPNARANRVKELLGHDDRA